MNNLTEHDRELLTESYQRAKERQMSQSKLPQRFTYRCADDQQWYFGMCAPSGIRAGWWSVVASQYGRFDYRTTLTPAASIVEMMDDIVEVRWIDNDYNWPTWSRSEQNAE